MILLEIVDAEQREPVPPEVLASLRKARQQSQFDPRPLLQPPPVIEMNPVQLDDNEDFFESKADSQRRRRIYRIAKIILSTYVVICVLGGISLLIMWRLSAFNRLRLPPRPAGIKPPPPPLRLLDLTALPSVDGKAVECNPWSLSVAEPDEKSPSSFIRFVVPVNETILIHANTSSVGSGQTPPVSGVLHASITDDAEQVDAVVTITKDSETSEVELVNVCLMRTEVGWGIAIYVPENVTEQSSSELLHINVLLPQTRDAAPLRGLITNLPYFNQTFGSLDSYTQLKNFLVQGSYGSVFVESVHAESILVKTSAAEIIGTFNTTDRIVLETVLAPVIANVSLVNDVKCNPTSLSVETGQGDVFLNVSLHEALHTGHGRPTFYNTIKTFGGALEAIFAHGTSTNGSALNIKAQNNFQRARVFIDSKFEGTYDVHTNLADATIQRNTDIADPLNIGRKRIFVNDHVSSDRVLGWVGWNRRPRGHIKGPGQGHVEVVSSLSAAVLELTESPSLEIPSNHPANAVSVQDTT